MMARTNIRLVVALALTTAVVVPWSTANAVPPPSVAVREWTEPVDVTPGSVRSPLTTAGGDVFAPMTRSGAARYAWKPFGEDWTSRARVAPKTFDVDDLSQVATGRHRVTAVWHEETESGELQYYSRWLDASGRRGPIVPVLEPQPDIGHVESHAASSTRGAIAVVYHYTGVRRVLVRDVDGEWRLAPQINQPSFSTAGVGIDDDGSVTIVGRVGQPSIVAFSSVAGGAWTQARVGPREGGSLGSGGLVVVAAGRDGDLVALWGEDGSSVLVAATRGPSVADPWETEALDEAYDCASCARAGVDDAGNAAVLWVHPIDDSFIPPVDVFVARHDSGDGSWSTQTILENQRDAFDDVPIVNEFIDVAPTGDVLAVYPDHQPSNGWVTFTCAPDPDAACQQQGALTGPIPGEDEESTFIHLAAVRSEGGVATWTPSCGPGCRGVVRAQSLE